MKKEKKKYSPYSEAEEKRLLMIHGYNPEVWNLGSLCGRGHDFRDSGCSVRNRKYKYCYECSKFVHIKHRETRLLKQAEYRLKNQDKIREYAKRYRRRNRERIAAYFKKWYAENRERVRLRRSSERWNNKVALGENRTAACDDKISTSVKKSKKGRSDGKKSTYKGGNS